MKYIKILYINGESYDYEVTDYDFDLNFLNLYNKDITEHVSVLSIDCIKASDTPFPVEENCEAISKEGTETTEETTQ